MTESHKPNYNPYLAKTLTKAVDVLKRDIDIICTNRLFDIFEVIISINRTDPVGEFRIDFNDKVNEEKGEE